jgi:hypothetical protein
MGGAKGNVKKYGTLMKRIWHFWNKYQNFVENTTNTMTGSKKIT